MSAYYGNLFKDKRNVQENNNSFLQNLDIPQIKPEDTPVPDAPIHLQEVEIAIKQLQCDKCPGPDGFPMNFIRKFYVELKHLLHNVMIQVDQDHDLNPSAKEGVISLMEKPAKDALLVTNWMPLSMLNCDHKIYAKIIANRLQYVLPYLISEDQHGFLKGRGTSDNLNDLFTVIEYFEQNKIEAVITTVDFEKAFDTVSWDAMKRIMEAFGFSKRFITLVMTCYQDFKAFTFLLVVETVGLKIKQDKDIIY